MADGWWLMAQSVLRKTTSGVFVFHNCRPCCQSRLRKPWTQCVFRERQVHFYIKCSCTFSTTRPRSRTHTPRAFHRRWNSKVPGICLIGTQYWATFYFTPCWTKNQLRVTNQRSVSENQGLKVHVEYYLYYHTIESSFLYWSMKPVVCNLCLLS